MIYRLFVFLCFLLFASAMWTMVPMERANINKRWVQSKRADPTQLHDVVIAIKHRNMDILELILQEVSDPSSPRYGQHLTFEQVGALTGNLKATEAVVGWLKEAGAKIVQTTARGEYITARAPVSMWEQMLGTEFYEFTHPRRGTVIRTPAYNVPAGKEQLVEAVFNTVQFPEEVAPLILTQPRLRGAGVMTPTLLNSYYTITNNDGNNLGSQSLYESLDQYFSPSDLAQFQELYGIPNDPVDEVIGEHESDKKCNLNANNCAEANLDVQYIMGVAQNVPTTYWYADTFLGWINTVANTADPPLVHSISYGSVEDSYPRSLATAFNNEAMKLGTMGVTVLVSSGDDGVANFNARDDPKECGYHPSFPASSPYVTAVGATQGPEDGTEEIACQSQEGGLITTGGGFSTIFTAPDWQTSTISKYFSSLTTAETPDSGYSKTGRGYPDVAMAGHNYDVIIGGRSYLLSGTSASAPVVGGMVSLVNSERLAAGKAPLGFLNPAIYQNGGVFKDVTSGINNCAAEANVCCDEGFYAVSGWDPLTGFGSVDFSKFSQTFAKL